MPVIKPTTRKIVTAKAGKPVTPKAPATATAVPALAVAATAQAAAGRSNVVPAPADAAPKAAKPSGHITRTAATIVAARTNFGGLSDRDNCYLSFYATFAGGDKRGAVTIESVHASGARPTYAGSNKPHDAGVIVRLTKAGLVSPASDGRSFSFTDKARDLAAVSTAKPRAAVTA